MANCAVPRREIVRPVLLLHSSLCCWCSGVSFPVSIEKDRLMVYELHLAESNTPHTKAIQK